MGIFGTSIILTVDESQKIETVSSFIKIMKSYYTEQSKNITSL